MTAIAAENRPYTPWGAARDLWSARVPEVMIAGPAGTGKSRAILEKLHFCMEKYPGARGLIFRKRRKDLTESGLVTWEEKVLPAGHPSLGRIRRENRHSYPYPNGSVVVVGGLDDAGKVMSTEYDLAAGLECRELDEGDWESVSVRCRNGVMPYQQVIGDTNPDAPGHWIKRRAAAGRLLLLESRHRDNPAMWDRRKGDWTAAGASYLARLAELTGVRRLRLEAGVWAQAEGVVYPDYDPAIHLVTPRPIPAQWTRYLSVDFGYTNPFVCQWWAQDGDGRLYLYREIYRTGRLVEDHARDIARLSAGEPRPRAVVCDHDAEDRATLERHLGWGTTPARKAVSSGIQAVTARLRRAGDGRPRLVIFRDATVERDAALAQAKKPTATAEEWESYVWADSARKEDPVKRDDHGLDCARYLVMHVDQGAAPYVPTAAPATTVVDDGYAAGAWGRPLG